MCTFLFSGDKMADNVNAAPTGDGKEQEYIKLKVVGQVRKQIMHSTIIFRILTKSTSE